MALIKCNECGKEISDKTNSCIHCGCPLGNSESNSSSGKLKISYPSDYKLNPKISVYLNKNLIAEVERATEKEVSISEDGTLLFKAGFRKTKVDVKKEQNYEITLSWNTFTGQLVAKVDSWS